MKTFKNLSAQGDMMLIRVDEIPAGLPQIKPENGAYIITHSETGHHHTVMERSDVKMFSAMDQFRAYLEIENEPVILEHLRSHDTHEAQEIKPGKYLVIRQREASPEGFRRAID